MRMIREPIEGCVPEDHEFDYTRKGIESVMFIRCLNHRAVPQENSSENNFGECGACIAEAKEGVITAVIGAIGGTVEGQPTNRANFLQRVRELVALEEIAIAARAFIWEGENWEAYQDSKESNSAAWPPEFLLLAQTVEKEYGPMPNECSCGAVKDAYGCPNGH